jgi:hypothetical protein
MLTHFLKAPLRLLQRAVPLSEEDRVINLAKAGNAQPFIDYFRSNDVQFTTLDHRRKASPSGRVVYENDIYSYVYVDGVWINRLELPLPYEERRRLFEEMESAVLSNCFGTVMYEQKHFKQHVPT